MAVVAYCVKCKAKKEMVDPQEGVTKNGRIITKGTCPDCGTKMSLIGGVAKKQTSFKALNRKHYKAGFLNLAFIFIMKQEGSAIRRAFLFCVIRVASGQGVTSALSTCHTPPVIPCLPFVDIKTSH